jgi:threonine synthase
MHVNYRYDSLLTKSQIRLALEPLSSGDSRSPPLFFQISELLPVQDETLYEVSKALAKSETRLPGSTELKGSNKYSNLFLKCEFQNPTGSFKDVGTISEFSKAHEIGLSRTAKEILVDPHVGSSSVGGSYEFDDDALHLASTGNMAISATYYACSLHLPLVLHVSKKINKTKLQRMKSYGLDSLNGVRRCQYCSEKDDGYDAQQNHVREEFEKQSGRRRLWIGDTTLRIEGCKTIGYEIYAQLRCKVPDNIIVPIGNGTLLCAVWKAFDELRKMEFTTEIPRIYGAVVPEYLHPKVSALGVSRPGDLTTAFKIIRDSGGGILSLDEEQILKGQELMFLQEDGIQAEAAGALSYAAYELFLRSSSRQGETSVAIITGQKCD